MLSAGGGKGPYLTAHIPAPPLRSDASPPCPCGALGWSMVVAGEVETGIFLSKALT